MRSVSDMPLKPDDRRAIERATAVLKAQFPVDQVILYGSKARGTDEADSDIDLLVLTSRPVGWQDQERLISASYPIQLEHGVLLSAPVVERKDWEEGFLSVLPIHDEVARDGVAAWRAKRRGRWSCAPADRTGVRGAASAQSRGIEGNRGGQTP